jgi:hypothetical protein
MSKDGGVEPHFRVYASNSCHCFAMHGPMRPTQLLAKWRGISRKDAAVALLEPKGMLRARSYREAWTELQIKAEQRVERMGDTSHAVAAVQSAMARDPNYPVTEFDAEVLAAWDKALAELDQLSASDHVKMEEVRAWFSRTCRNLAAAALTAVQHGE